MISFYTHQCQLGFAGAMTSRFSRDLRAALGDSFSIHRLGEQVFCWMVLQAATSLAEECKDII